MKLKVKSNSKSMVVNVKTLAKNTQRRYIGRKFDAALNAYVVVESGEEIESTSEIIKAVREDCLIPLDKETADFCGVHFAEPKKAEPSVVKTEVKATP